MKNRFRIEIKSLTEQGTFEGLLSVYNVVDAGNDLVESGAFTKTLKEHGNEVPLLWQHKPDMPIGKLTLEDMPDALHVKGELLMDLPDAQNAYALIKAGIVKGLSIGYETIKKATDGTVRRLKELRLFEGSLVTFPMNESAIVTAVKARETKGSFDEELTTIQLRDSRYQMENALSSALYSIIWNSNLTTDQKVAAAAETIQQFTDAYLAFLPAYLDMMFSPFGMKAMEQKAGRRISQATRETIQSAIDNLSALLSDEAGSSATSDGEAAAKSEPVDHSALSGGIDEMIALLRAA